MNPMFLLHTAFLSISVLLTFAWTRSPYLSTYNLQLTGALILLYFLNRLLSSKSKSTLSGLLDTLILTSTCLLLVFSTGGLNSPLFLLLTFLLFAIALLFEPIQALTISLLIIGMFVWESNGTLQTNQIINLASLFFVTPLAILFSRTYLNNLASSGKISILKQALNKEKTDDLLWVSTKANPSLNSALNSISDLIVYANSKGSNFLPTGFIDKLKTIQSDIVTLYKSTGTFETSVKESADSVDETIAKEE